jgi:hypothetical protein
MKTCRRCKQDKPLEQFSFRSISLNTHHTICKTCTNIEISNHYYNNKEYYITKAKRNTKKFREFVNKYKESRPCSDCGNYYPSYVMDFDHLRDKTINVAKVWDKSSFLAEVEKCEIVCSNCHRIRTHNRLMGL